MHFHQSIISPLKDHWALQTPTRVFSTFICALTQLNKMYLLVFVGWMRFKFYLRENASSSPVITIKI